MEQNSALERKRIGIIDTLRGVAIIYMVFYHFIFDLAMMNVDWGTRLLESQSVVVLFDSGLFCLLSGICCCFSRNNAMRGAKLMLWAFLVTAVTVVAMPDAPITFGVLHMLSTCMLVYAALEKFLDKIPPLAALPVSALLTAIFWNTKRGWIGIGEIRVEIPDFLREGSRLYPLGLIDYSYRAADYFPLMPYLWLFLCGVFLGKLLIEHREKLPQFAYSSKPKFLSFLGRHSLFIYIVHQPVALVLAWICSLIW